MIKTNRTEKKKLSLSIECLHTLLGGVFFLMTLVVSITSKALIVGQRVMVSHLSIIRGVLMRIIECG